jgi:hypothetical protein
MTSTVCANDGQDGIGQRVFNPNPASYGHKDFNKRSQHNARCACLPTRIELLWPRLPP